MSCDLLPERDRPQVLARIRGAWALNDPDLAEQRLRAARLRARPHLARRGRLAAGGHARDADADAARNRRTAREDAVLDEPLREHDRDRPSHPAQRQALARRRHAQALDRRRDARKRSGNSDESSATATSPSSSSPSNDTPRSTPTRTSTTKSKPNPLPFNRQPVRTAAKFHDDPDILTRGIPRLNSLEPEVVTLLSPEFSMPKTARQIRRSEFATRLPARAPMSARRRR